MRLRRKMQQAAPSGPEDPSLIQRLALVTYKSRQPTPQAALEEARELLRTLGPATTNDTETLGLWGEVHWRLWDATGERANLDEAVRSYERGFYLRNDYYNGINLAFLLNQRAAHASRPADAIADFVRAQRARREVIAIGQQLEDSNMLEADRQRLSAMLGEAYLGVGELERAESFYDQASSLARNPEASEEARERRAKLTALLADSPLKYLVTDMP